MLRFSDAYAWNWLRKAAATPSPPRSANASPLGGMRGPSSIGRNGGTSGKKTSTCNGQSRPDLIPQKAYPADSGGHYI